jgi:hypothetical protein
MIILFGITALLCWFLIWRPVLKAQDKAETIAFRETYRAFEAFAVLKYHPAVQASPRLSRLSVRDLRRHYNVTDAYNDIR